MKTTTLILFSILLILNSVAQQSECFDSCFFNPDVNCFTLYDPVCGCDQVEYSNSCVALASGISSWSVGPCDNSLCNASIELIPEFIESTGSSDEPQTYAADEYCFTIQSSIELGENVQILWEFGTGETSSVLDPCIIFPTILDGEPVSNPYHITLTITDEECVYIDNLMLNCAAEESECMDLENVDFGLCAMPLGICVINNSCEAISGCSTIGSDGVDYSSYFFSNYEDCIEDCGTCVNIDLINESILCPSVIEPVCGCDGVTYNNSCVALHYHGVTLTTDGPCETQAPAPCDDLTEVDFGECELLLGVGIVNGLCSYISGCGSTGADGIDYSGAIFENMSSCVSCDQSACFNPQQVDVNGGCDTDYTPVCGCDSMTYSNYCEAMIAGITSWDEGECVTNNIPSNEMLDFEMYPNPTNNELTISFVGARRRSIRVLNSLGQEVFTTEMDSQHLTLSLNDLPSGMYILESSETNAQFTQKRFFKK